MIYERKLEMMLMRVNLSDDSLITVFFNAF